MASLLSSRVMSLKFPKIDTEAHFSMFFKTFEAVGNISDIISNRDQVAGSNDHCYVSNTTSKPDLRGGAPASTSDLGTEAPALRCDLGTKVPAPRYDLGSEAQDRITEERSRVLDSESRCRGTQFQIAS